MFSALRSCSTRRRLYFRRNSQLKDQTVVFRLTKDNLPLTRARTSFVIWDLWSRLTLYKGLVQLSKGWRKSGNFHRDVSDYSIRSTFLSRVQISVAAERIVQSSVALFNMMIKFLVIVRSYLEVFELRFRLLLIGERNRITIDRSMLVDFLGLSGFSSFPG